MKEEKMRIAVILPSFDVGGTENMVANLAKYINKERYEVLVISLAAPRNTHVQKMIEDSGVKIAYCMKGEVNSLKVFRNVYAALKKFGPNLIHSNMYAYFFAVPYLMLHRIHLLHTIHNKPVNEFKSKYKKVISFLYKIGKATPVAISHIVEKEMKEIYPTLSVIERVYNPVEVGKFYVERICEKKNPVIFIKVARFMKQKNHALLINAFADALQKVGDMELWLVGDGVLRSDLEKQVEDLKLEKKVHFIGTVNNVQDYLAKADVFVMSSDYEGLPLSLLEAMAAGLPIISTNVGGVADIVTNNGILVEAGDRQALSDAMIQLVNDYQLRYQMGCNSLQNSKEFDSNSFIKQYEELYIKYTNL